MFPSNKTNLGTYNFTGMSLFTGCGQSLVSTTRGSRTGRVINCWKRWCLEEIQLSELPGKITSFIGVARIIFEAPLQMQCKSITCTTPFPIPLTLQSMVESSWAQLNRAERSWIELSSVESSWAQLNRAELSWITHNLEPTKCVLQGHRRIHIKAWICKYFLHVTCFPCRFGIHLCSSSRAHERTSNWTILLHVWSIRWYLQHCVLLLPFWSSKRRQSQLHFMVLRLAHNRCCSRISAVRNCNVVLSKPSQTSCGWRGFDQQTTCTKCVFSTTTIIFSYHVQHVSIVRYKFMQVITIVQNFCYNNYLCCIIITCCVWAGGKDHLSCKHYISSSLYEQWRFSNCGAGL